MRSAVVSVGYGHSHMYQCAEWLARINALDTLICTAYPKPWMQRSRAPWMRRLIERRIDLNGAGLWTAPASELLWQVGMRNVTNGRDRGYKLVEMSQALYGRRASKALSEHGEYVLHFRAGFGGQSLTVAKRLGIPTVCDHSIAHPHMLAVLTGQDRRSASYRQRWARVEADIEAADVVLVNSDFVKETCVDAGIAAEKVHVAYAPIDEAFGDFVGRQLGKPARPRDALKVLFAGTVEQRKGIDTLCRVVEQTSGAAITYTIAGQWMPDAEAERMLLEESPSVDMLGQRSRRELAELMMNHHVLILPTRAEGSARVVTEAMVAGLFVVTTRESGIPPGALADGVSIHKPNDASSMASALVALSGKVADEPELGKVNQDWASRELTRTRYIDAVQAAYSAAAHETD